MASPLPTDPLYPKTPRFASGFGDPVGAETLGNDRRTAAGLVRGRRSDNHFSFEYFQGGGEVRYVVGVISNRGGTHGQQCALG